MSSVPFHRAAVAVALASLAGCATPTGFRPEAPGPGATGPERSRKLVVAQVLAAPESSDDFQELLAAAGLPAPLHFPPAGLGPRRARLLLDELGHAPLSLRRFGPRLVASYLLREVMAGGREVPETELTERLQRFGRIIILRPDGYLAWAISGRAICYEGRVEMRDGALRAHQFEVGAFYASRFLVFFKADEKLEPVGDPIGEATGNGAIESALDGAQDALIDVAVAIGQLIVHPIQSLADLARLPEALRILILTSPAYWERFQLMPLEEQVRAVSHLATTLLTLYGSAGGSSIRLTGAAGGLRSLTIPRLALAADGALALERVEVPVGTLATTLGGGPAAVYVLHMANSSLPGEGALASERTRPSRKPDPSAKPRGRPSEPEPNDDAQRHRALMRENESADTLAKAGFDVEQNPNVPGPKRPDYRIEGRVFDNYAPTSNNPRSIWSEISDRKVNPRKGSRQADRIVVNLKDTGVTVDALRKQFVDWPMPNLKEVLTITIDGAIVPIWP